MDPLQFNKTLENARNALRILQEQLLENANALSQSQSSQNGNLGEQIAALTNLTQELEKIAPTENTNNENILTDDNNNNAIDDEEVENKAREKVIQVPVRRRTVRSRDGDPLSMNTNVNIPPRTFAMELPATPFHPRPAAATEPPSTIAPRPTPGMPADTPMAVQVLANLCALGIDVSAIDAISARMQGAAFNQHANRRNAAIRAAQAAAPRPPRNTASTAARRACNCKRSQCLKLYCECFSASGFCMPGCACLNCLNSEADIASVNSARRAILAKDPAAFDDKVTAEDGHKKGCKCKRSKCLKKYCECYNGGVECNPEVCSCEGCRNGPGTQAGADGILEEEEDIDAEEEQPVKRRLPQPPKLAAPLCSPPPAAAAAAGMSVLVSPLSAEEQQRAAAMTALFSPVAFGVHTVPGGLMYPTVAVLPEAVGGVAALLPHQEPPQQEEQEEGQQQHQQQQAIDIDSIPAAADHPADTAMVPEETADPSPQDIAAIAIATASAPTTNLAKPTPGAMNVPPADDHTPGLPRASALTSHISDFNGTGSDFADTASSPGFHNNAQAHRRIAAATMTGGGKPGEIRVLEEDSRGKRPRRAASGGVVGAIAAETSDWGLDLVSPPTKPANSTPDAMLDVGKGTALAARRERTNLLRKALQNDAAAAHKGHVAEEEDVISALVSMSSLG